MKGESQLEVSLLILLMSEFYPEVNATSELIGSSAGCSPVVVRRIYGKLKDAGLLDTKPGGYGLHLAKDPHDISLWDICSAIRPMDAAGVFGTEHEMSGTCPISGNIHEVLTKELDSALDAMREKLEKVSLYDLAWKLPDTYEVPVEEQLEKMRGSLHEAEKRFG
ncbi:MAG: Rrf2 family transcriptional regulator [Coriobacteriales bacterium]|jgi:DNA-binding IscR family transcriptional regulator